MLIGTNDITSFSHNLLTSAHPTSNTLKVTYLLMHKGIHVNDCQKSKNHYRFMSTFDLMSSFICMFSLN